MGPHVQMNYQFAGFELDTDRLELRQNGQELAIAPKAFSVLAYLVEHNDRMVTKAELLDAFWSANVSEAALQTTMSLVRKALRPKVKQGTIIKTYHGHGFRMVRPVTSTITEAKDGPEQLGSALKLVRERRLVAVLCAQLTTGRHRASPDQQSNAIEAFIETARSQIEKDQGRLIRMMIDGFTVSFGLDPHFEDGARRAAYCASRLVETMKGDATGFSASFGIETGLVSRESGGNGNGWTPPDEIERCASLLAQKAGNGEIYLNETTRTHLGEEVETDPVSDGYLLTSSPEPKSGIPARPHKRPTRFVGRNGEIAFLSATLSNSSQGIGKAITLTGPAGIGKSRLVSEFLLSRQAAPIRKVKIQCLPRLHETSLAPIRQMCLKLFRNPADRFVEDRLETAMLNWILDDTIRPDPILESMSDKMRQQQSRDLVLRLLKDTCAKEPLILIFEDVHWIDKESHPYLDAMIRSADSTGLLLIVTTRHVNNPIMEDAVIQLPPFGHDESLSMLRQIPEAHDLSAADAETLVTRAAGNPFFLEELALAVGLGTDANTNLPDTVQAVIEVRIDELEIRLRTLLYVIAVAGPPSAISLIAHLVGQPAEKVEPDLARLVRQGFLVVDLAGYSFRHMLLNDTAYAMVAPNDRKGLHKNTADFLQSALQQGTGRKERPETLAWHFQEAGEVEQAIAYWAKASQAAIYRADRRDAIGFSQNGLSLLAPNAPDNGKMEMSLQLSLGAALMAVEGYGSPLVGKALARAHVLGKKVGPFKSQVQILSGLLVHSWVAGRLSAAIGHAGTLLEMSRQVENPALLLQANAGMGEVLFHSNTLAQAMQHLKAGLAQAKPEAIKSISAQNSAVTCAAYCAWVAGLQGNIADMQAYRDQSLELSQVIMNPFATAIHLALISETFMFVDDTDGCHDLADRAVAISRKHDFPFWLGTGLVMKGWALGRQGQIESALATIDEGIAIFRGTGARIQLANWYGLKADTLLVANRPQEGLEVANLALKYASQTGDTWFTPRIHAIASGLCHQLDQPKNAALHQAYVDGSVQLNNLADSFVKIRVP